MTTEQKEQKREHLKALLRETEARGKQLGHVASSDVNREAILACDTVPAFALDMLIMTAEITIEDQKLQESRKNESATEKAVRLERKRNELKAAMHALHEQSQMRRWRPSDDEELREALADADDIDEDEIDAAMEVIKFCYGLGQLVAVSKANTAYLN